MLIAITEPPWPNWLRRKTSIVSPTKVDSGDILRLRVRVSPGAA